MKFGIEKTAIRVTNDNKEKVTISVNFDYRNVAENDMLDWASSNRVIAFQRVLRTLSANEIKALDGRTIDARYAGHKIESDEKIRARFYETFLAAGLDETEASEMADKAMANRNNLPT
jgi:hypothetical protein